jgi:ABC-type ATPase with predicted acetyltransferase domain
MKFSINKIFNSSVERTPRVLEVAEAFGLGLENKEFVVYKDFEIEVKQGDVIYITGQSGSGKSLLLRELAKQMRNKKGLNVADVELIQWDEDKPLIDQVGETMAEAIRILSIAGINDAYLLVRTPKQLSDGQKYRLALAKLVESGANVWVADEFGAKLDRITAKVVAFSMQKVARQVGATLIVATTHIDLGEELGATLTVEKRYMNQVKLMENSDVR